MRRSGGFWFLAAVGALAVLVLYLIDRFPGALSGRESRIQLVYLVLLLTFVGGSLLVRLSARPGAALRQVTAWIAIGLVIVIGYSYRDVLVDLQRRLAGELLPQRGVTTSTGAISFAARDDGHFHAEALVDGQPVLFLIDTGASDVVLSPDDARRLGFDPDRLDYTQIYQTANGQVRGAPVHLGEIVIGPIRITDLRASVNETPLPHSLLGMSFLDRLSGYEVSRGKLTLRQ
jgi:aspartyl protease family protein